MRMLVTVKCDGCGTPVKKDKREVVRSAKLKRGLFCTRSCAAFTVVNEWKRAKTIQKTCPCGRKFGTTTKARAKEHCSRGCASKYSMSEARREAQSAGGRQSAGNLLVPADVLGIRERWKYARLTEHLGDRPHRFEFQVGAYVFDLALFDTQTLIEFDGPYHRGSKQTEADLRKDAVAVENGFVVQRRLVKPNVVIDPSVLAGL